MQIYIYNQKLTNSYVVVLFRKITKVRDNSFSDSVRLVLKPFLCLTKHLKKLTSGIKNCFKLSGILL